MKTQVDDLRERHLAVPEIKLTAKDFASDQDVRWCPGCGDYSILAQVQRILPDFGIPRHNLVFVSGIGCSSRFPYYMSTYGFHGIHGRAPAIASGLKIARPDLSVWVATGDGDGLSIGGNHFIHLMRRNIDIKVLLFNNQIYGLTKGQYSPTSETGKKTKSTPFGSVEPPFNPVGVAIGSQATFVARSLDRDAKHLQYVLRRAAEHKGTAFVEVYQNCVVFNDGAFDQFTDKETKDDSVLLLEHGKPLMFGKAKNKGIKLDGMKPVIIDLADGSHSVNDCLVYDEHDTAMAYLFAEQTYKPGFPRPIGVFLKLDHTPYDVQLDEQIAHVKEMKGELTLEQLLMSGETWRIS